ncbi:MAG: C-terminal target protein [Bacteroidetes bacterium]|jgi:hypothetical protein|nr:C-terminal target protein [Bacteroidota bacterium]
MKKLYFIGLSMFALFQSNAQTSYTLTQTNSEPVIGDAYLPRLIDTTTALPMNISGSSVTWNLTGLVDSLATDSNKYIDPSADANSGNYPGVTIVQSSPTNIAYFKSSMNQYELLGMDITFNGMTANVNYNTNSALLAQYPMSMGYSNTDSVKGAITISTFAGTFIGTISTTADGTGTLNLNGMSSFSNCLRLKTVQHIDFSLMGGLETGTMDQVIYNYYSSFSKFPVLTVNYNHVMAGGVFAVDDTLFNMSTLSSVVIGVKENKLNDIIFKAYPNPANNEINLYFVLVKDESYSFEVINTLGQVVKTVSMPNLHAGMYNETINTSDLSSGVYTIKVNGKSSQGTEKLVIQK